MKKIFFTIAFLASLYATAQKDPIVLEVGDNKVPKSEFLQIYLKNNDHPKYDKKTLDDYVDLFVKFKLKVAEAEAEKYDTLPKLNRELSGYKNTLAQPYLTDQTKQEQLVEQAYNRLKKEIRASHILVKVSPTASPEDTLKAYNRILALKKRIEAGEDFETVARSTGGSDDPSVAVNGGDLGYFTAFQMVYPFEEAAYTTPVGKISAIIRTNYGYHILKVVDKRPARGTISTAHIMVAVKQGANKSEQENALKKANEIYEKAKNGEDFAQLAKEYSDDSQSAEKGGQLPEFGSGTTTRMIPSFEDAAFALKENGDISKPIQTDYGYHIIKRLDWKPLASFDEMKKELQRKVSKDERSQITQDSFVEKLKKEYHFKDKSKKTLQWFYKNIDSSYFKTGLDLSKLKSDDPLFVLNKINYGQKRFGDYVNKHSKFIRNGSFKDIIDTHYEKFIKSSILDYEKTRLEDKYPDFKALMKEYHDGVLLFEIMSNKVWNKASQDSVGLEKYFEANRENYKWEKRADAYVYVCDNDQIAKEVYGMIQKNDTISSKTIIEKMNKTSQLNLKVLTNKYEIDNTPFLKDKNLKKGLNPVYAYDGKYYVVKVTDLLEPSLKSFDECRGLVISNYQNYLEDAWIKELRAKYPVKIHEEVLYHLNDK